MSRFKRLWSGMLLYIVIRLLGIELMIITFRHKELVNEKLKHIRFDSDLFKCKNVTCLEHNNMLQSVYEDVLSICISSADKCITNVNAGHCREQRVPGWHDHVAEYHQEELYWDY